MRVLYMSHARDPAFHVPSMKWYGERECRSRPAPALRPSRRMSSLKRHAATPFARGASGRSGCVVWCRANATGAGVQEGQGEEASVPRGGFRVEGGTPCAVATEVRGSRHGRVVAAGVQEGNTSGGMPSQSCRAHAASSGAPSPRGRERNRPKHSPGNVRACAWCMRRWRVFAQAQWEGGGVCKRMSGSGMRAMPPDPAAARSNASR